MNILNLKPTISMQFLLNIDEKLSDNEFVNDFRAILRPNAIYDNITGWDFIKQKFELYR
jgi:hypothetical protein